MPRIVKLHATQREFQALFEAANKPRAKNVTVSRQALLNVMMDHSKMIRILGPDAQQAKPGEND